MRFDDDSNDYETSEIAGKVEEYKTEMQLRTGKTVVEARLMLEGETKALAANNTDILYGTTTAWDYWLGTPAYGYGDREWYVYGSFNRYGDIGCVYYVHPTTEEYLLRLGLRPLIIMNKADL